MIAVDHCQKHMNSTYGYINHRSQLVSAGSSTIALSKGTLELTLSLHEKKIYQ
jgi:hypothetical protein